VFEAELKFSVNDFATVEAVLAERAVVEPLTYYDAYFEHEGLGLAKRDAELRVREMVAAGGTSTTWITYKGGIVDPSTESKTEYELRVDADRQEAKALLLAMGFFERIAFVKQCRRFVYAYRGRNIQATLARLEESPQWFLELECLTHEKDDIASALEVLWTLANEVGVDPRDFTTIGYSDIVQKVRDSSSAGHDSGH
jgi:predicted adenylyl cyclase CyaB